MPGPSSDRPAGVPDATPERGPVARRNLAARIGLVVVVGLVLAVAWRAGALEPLAEPRTLAARIVALGAWGYLGFVVAYALFQPFGVPGTIFIVAAPLLWPWPTAFALSMVGTMAASVVGFSFARFVARDWVAARIPARLRRYDDALERHALRTVVVLRLVLWMPPMLHAFFGVSKVRFWTHFAGSFLGYVPPLLVVSYFGSRMFDASGRMQPAAWPVMGGLAAASLVVVLLSRWSSVTRRFPWLARSKAKPS